MARIVNFLDIETTGSNQPDERIIEHCSMLFDLDSEAHVATHTWRINPMCKIKPSAQSVHGISADMLAHEPVWDAVAPSIRATIENAYMVVAHNGLFFDFDFLEREFARIGHRFMFPLKFDTMLEGKWAHPLGKFPKLGELAQCLDVEYDPAKAHSAEYDVSVMAQCFFEGRKLGWFNA